MKTSLHVYKMEQQCSVVSNLTPILSLTWSRQYNGLVSLCNNMSFSPCCSESSPQNYWLNMWTTTKCPVYNYEHGMSKLQWDASLSPVKIQTKPPKCQIVQCTLLHCTMYTTVKTSHKSFSAQVFHSRKKVDVNTGCSPTTLQPRKPKHTSPHQNYTATISLRLFWHTVHAHYAGAK